MLVCFIWSLFLGRTPVPHLLAVPLLGLLLVLPDNAFILGAQLWKNRAQFWPSGWVHLHIHFIPGDARPHLLKFLKSRQMFILSTFLYKLLIYSKPVLSFLHFWFLPHPGHFWRSFLNKSSFKATFARQIMSGNTKTPEQASHGRNQKEGAVLWKIHHATT